MSFDYFNTSHLAFGAKISKAFLQLNRLLQEGEDNLQDLFQIYQFYDQYIDKNYPAPFPTRPDAPVRCKELYDLLNDGNTLRSVRLDNEKNLTVVVNLFKRISNRFTIATGTTTLKEGYAFCKDSISNKNYTREIQFVEDYDNGIGNFLFEYRIDSDDNINIIGDSYKYYIPSNFDHITTMEKGATVFTNQNITMQGYTAEDYEAILIVGYGYPWDGSVNPGNNDKKSDLHIKINDETVVNITGWMCRQYGVVYLKPGDVLNADCKTAFKIKYRSGEPVPPQPTPTPTPVPVPEEIMTQYSTDGSVWTDLSASTSTDSFSAHLTDMYNKTYVRGLITLDNRVEASDIYQLSFSYTGNPAQTNSENDILLSYLDDGENVLSSTHYYPEPEQAGGSVTSSIPLGTSKIAIANMGWQFVPGTQRYEDKLAVSSIDVSEIE